MKHRVLAVVIPALMALANSSQAAEIYNQDGNKLALHFKIDGLHYLSDNDNSDGDHSYVRGGFSGETQITDMLTGYGMWEYQANLNHTEGEDNKNFKPFRFCGTEVWGLWFLRLWAKLRDYLRHYVVD
jgi:outer membrane pore protein C